MIKASNDSAMIRTACETYDKELARQLLKGFPILDRQAPMIVALRAVDDAIERESKAAEVLYRCPQCGPDANGPVVHQLTHHTTPPMTAEEAKAEIASSPADEPTLPPCPGYDALRERVLDGNILACPFCGGEAGASQGAKGDGSPFAYVECCDCGAMADPEEWQQRAPPTSLSKNVKFVKALAMALRDQPGIAAMDVSEALEQMENEE